jgi:GNAT superfamily N-acetyltransferase
MELSFDAATEVDAAEIAALRTAVAAHLTRHYGHGHWSSTATEHGVVRGMRTARVLVARDTNCIVATLALATKKPWAIDPSCFTPALRPLYLTDMAVDPALQRRGIGRRLVAEAVGLCRAVTADAIRLDAYDASAGAGAFYTKCGFRETGRAVFRNTPLIYFELLL